MQGFLAVYGLKRDIKHQSVSYYIIPGPAEPGHALPMQTVYIQISWYKFTHLIPNSVDPDQLASEETNWSGSTSFGIKYFNLYQQSESSNLIGWKSEVGMAF